MTDMQKSILGDKEAARRLTNAGVLLPCPMCRGEGVLDSEFLMGVFWVMCTGCGLQTEAFETEKEARLAWNTRAPILMGSEMEMLEGDGMNTLENKKVIIRSDKAGVFFGTLKEKNGNEVTLTNARRLWYWDGAATISQLAVTGTVCPENCKFTVYVDVITILGVIEIIPCTDDAIQSIEGVKVWKR